MKNVLAHILCGLGIVLSIWGTHMDQFGLWLDKKAYEIWSR